MRIEPVPFHLPIPGRDSMGFGGIGSVSYRIVGLLHLDSEVMTFEWSTTSHRERVSLTSVSVDDDATPPELLEIPTAWVAGASLKGRWRPRLTLRGRRLDAFDGVPGAGVGTITVRIARRDRQLARALIVALAGLAKEWALGGGASPAEQLPPVGT